MCVKYMYLKIFFSKFFLNEHLFLGQSGSQKCPESQTNTSSEDSASKTETAETECTDEKERITGIGRHILMYM